MSKLSFQDAKGKKMEVKGYQFAKAGPKTKTYQASGTDKLPNKVDLRPFLTPIEDQGKVGSCTANAVAGAVEYLIKKQSKAIHDVSRLFIYYNARLRGGTQNKDSGSVIQYAVENLKTLGACAEKIWAYDTKKVLLKPDKKAYDEAKKVTIPEFERVPVKLELWKRCLAEGNPIIFGCALFGSFDKCNQMKGIVPMPSPEDATRGKHGLHAMLCVGYSDIDQMFIVRNSWGTNWGDKGYCYMPYNYLMNPKFNLGDSWILRSVDGVPKPEETWQDDKVSIIDEGKGYDFEIIIYEIEEYVEIPDDAFLDEEYIFEEGEYQEPDEQFIIFIEDEEHEAYWDELDEEDIEEMEDEDEEEGEDEEEEEDEGEDEEEEDEGEDEEEEEDEGEDEEEEDEGEDEEEDESEDEEENK